MNIVNMSTTSSRQQSNSTPSTPTAADPVTIYKHNRGLGGIISSISRAPALIHENDASIPTLGPAADRYLQAHGYNLSALLHISHAYEQSDSQVGRFLGYLTSRGMPWTEAEYLWELIHNDGFT